jgi:hypothetical protein
MTELRPDILIVDRHGSPIAAVEVTNREHLSAELATALRRNLVAHGYVPPTPYYLLLTQYVGYLWKQPDPTRLDPSPDYQFPLDNVIQRYLRSELRRRLSGGNSKSFYCSGLSS